MTERLTAKNSDGYPAPAGIAADPVLLTVRDGRAQVLIVEDSKWGPMLPGGFVAPHQSAEQTARQILERKTGLDDIYMEQMASFTDPDRDHRGWIPTIAYLALVPAQTEPKEHSSSWLPVAEMPRLAFDHNDIVTTAMDRVAGKLWWSNIAVGVLREPFTFPEAREVYQAFSGAVYHPSTFARDLWRSGLLEKAEGVRQPPKGRPAALYRFSSQTPIWGLGRNKRVATAAA